jgi:hypothetical protein
MAQESHEYLIEQTQFNEDKGLTTAQNRVDLTFNHPVKELIWVTQYSWRKNCTIPPPAQVTISSQTYKYGISPLTYDDVIYDCALQLNGQDRMQSLPGDYFAVVQPFQHHSGTNFLDGRANNLLFPSFGAPNSGVDGPWNPWRATPTESTGATTQPLSGGVYMYSFAIKPEEHQPSGTCNFSRIDTATLVFSIDGAKPVGQSVSVPNPTDLADVNATIDIRVYAINYNILRTMSGMGGLAYSN